MSHRRTICGQLGGEAQLCGQMESLEAVLGHRTVPEVLMASLVLRGGFEEPCDFESQACQHRVGMTTHAVWSKQTAELGYQELRERIWELQFRAYGPEWIHVAFPVTAPGTCTLGCHGDTCDITQA